MVKWFHFAVFNTSLHPKTEAEKSSQDSPTVCFVLHIYELSEGLLAIWIKCKINN